MGLILKYLIDSNIIIYHLNGEKTATDFIVQNIDICAISRISFIEVMSFSFNNDDELNVVDLLNSFKILDTSEQIAIQSIKNRKMKKIKVPDNIIASTAQVHNLILVTRNESDFNLSDIEILNIFS